MRGRAQRGAAVVMAMLVVAVTATLVTGVFWRQSVIMRQAENELSYAQAKWLIRGAIDWAGVILREDARTSSVDHLGEPWAVPLADTHLNPDDGRDPVYLAGAIRDEQAKFNLRNLAGPKGVNPRELAVLRRLLALVGAAERLADPVELLPGARRLTVRAFAGGFWSEPGTKEVGVQPLVRATGLEVAIESSDGARYVRVFAL